MATKIPKSLGGQIDTLYRLRSERLEIEREVDRMKKDEQAIREVILAHLVKERATKAAGKLASVSAVTKVIGKVEDWAALWEWARKNDAPEIFQRRINNSAWRERVESGQHVSGVESETVVDLSLNAISKG